MASPVEQHATAPIATQEVRRQPTIKNLLAQCAHDLGNTVVRRTDYLFLAMIAFAAAIASAPRPPVPLLGQGESWLVSDRSRLALNELDPSGNPIHP